MIRLLHKMGEQQKASCNQQLTCAEHAPQCQNRMIKQKKVINSTSFLYFSLNLPCLTSSHILILAISLHQSQRLKMKRFQQILERWFLFFWFFETRSHYYRLYLNSLYSSHWPSTHGDSPASVSLVPGLQVYTTTPGSRITFLNWSCILHLSSKILKTKMLRFCFLKFRFILCHGNCTFFYKLPR